MTLPRAWYAVLKPAASLPTAAIFASALLKRDTEAVIVTGSFADALVRPLDGAGKSGAGFEGWVDRIVNGFGRNDLQAAAESQCNDVALAARWLQSRFGNGRMTGSGSAVFARAGTGDQPVATFPAGPLPPGWVGRMCRSLDQHPLAGWAN